MSHGNEDDIKEYSKEELKFPTIVKQILTVLQNDAISQIDITNGNLQSFKEIDCRGTTLGIFEIDDGYIMWGEEEIIRLDSSLDQVWCFSGKDIFVSQTYK